MILLLSTSFFFTLIINTTYAQINTSVKQLIIINHNGIRGPLRSYPTDPYGEAYWSRYGGLGQSTPKGLVQLYQIGQQLKNFYNSFLTFPYSPARVRIRSVDTDASLMSANAFISGMYPPANSDQLWSLLSWFPMPIHPMDSFTDQIIREECYNYEKLIEESLYSNDYFQMQTRYMKLLNDISGFTGLGNLTFLELSDIYDNAVSKSANGLNLEQWMSDNLKNLKTVNDFNLNLKYGSLEKARLISGGILYDLIDKFRTKMANPSSKNEIHIYTVLESHFASLMTLLNLNEPLAQVEFGQMLIFELRRSDPDDRYFIRLLFRNSSIPDRLNLAQIKLKGCDELCSFGNFFELTNDRVVTDFAEACGDQIILYNTTTPITQTTSYYTTPCVDVVTTPSETENTQVQNNGQLTRLEVSLIIVTSLLAALVISLAIIVALCCYKNRLMNEEF